MFHRPPLGDSAVARARLGGAGWHGVTAETVDNSGDLGGLLQINMGLDTDNVQYITVD